ncbi:hypothetical protein PCK1_002560 [Pneumocystis canis]|nr:hypothetical protein PCK1_002560 [Pneumocystis canis]
MKRSSHHSSSRCKSFQVNSVARSPEKALFEQGAHGCTINRKRTPECSGHPFDLATCYRNAIPAHSLRLIDEMARFILHYTFPEQITLPYDYTFLPEKMPFTFQNPFPWISQLHDTSFHHYEDLNRKITFWHQQIKTWETQSTKRGSQGSLRTPSSSRHIYITS